MAVLVTEDPRNPLRDAHAHLLQRSNGTALCSCDAGAVLFSYRSPDRGPIRVPHDRGEWNETLRNHPVLPGLDKST